MNKMKAIFSEFSDATLFYSGGKDSLACLLLAEPWWDKLTVVFVDTGEVFPEVQRHMERVKALVPRFVTLHSNVKAYHDLHGLPVDVVPTRNTAMGDLLWGNEGIRVCSRFDCCKANMWDVMQRYFEITRPKCVIRGDRGSERKQGGSVWENVAFRFPIFNWTTAQVHDLLKRDIHGLVEERHFLEASSSLDCTWCTGYFEEQHARLPYLKKHYPVLAEQYVKFYKKYKKAVSDEMALIGGVE